MPNREERQRIVSAYENALRALERNSRPDDYPGLTPETRRRANFQQFEIFYNAYWPMWRYAKIILYRRLMNQREDVAQELRRELPNDHISSDSRTCQEFTIDFC